MNTEAFDGLMASADAPLIVVTVASGAERTGCLVGFHAQSSIDPRRYCVWLSKANRTYDVALCATHLGVHFLTSADVALAELFGTCTGDEIDKFELTSWASSAEGVPMLSQLPHHLVGRRVALLDEGGDHAAFVLKPVASRWPEPFEPLRMSRTRHLVPGHDNGDRR